MDYQCNLTNSPQPPSSYHTHQVFYVLQVNLSWYLLMEFLNEVDHASCYLLLPNIIHYEGDGNLMARGGREGP